MADQFLSFTTFNLFNLHVAGKPIYDEPGWTPEQYEAKLGWTRGMLRQAWADVFGFQELWTTQALVDAFTGLPNHFDYDLITNSAEDDGNINCAAAVRKGLLVPGSARFISDFPDTFRLASKSSVRNPGDVSVKIERFSRPVLHFKIQPEGTEQIDVFVCHLKSKRPTDIDKEDWYVAADHRRHREALGSALSTVRRSAEAAALRMIVTDVAKGDMGGVVVMGDLNDGQLSTTLSIVTGAPRYLTGKRTGEDDTGLYSAQTLQEYRASRDVYFTYIHNDMHQSLDHILVSEQLYDNSSKRVWEFVGLDVWNDHLNPRRKSFSPSGDHGVVRARFAHAPIG